MFLRSRQKREENSHFVLVFRGIWSFFRVKVIKIQTFLTVYNSQKLKFTFLVNFETKFNKKFLFLSMYAKHPLFVVSCSSNKYFTSFFTTINLFYLCIYFSCAFLYFCVSKFSYNLTNLRGNVSCFCRIVEHFIFLFSTSHRPCFQKVFLLIIIRKNIGYQSIWFAQSIFYQSQ